MPATCPGVALVQLEEPEPFKTPSFVALHGAMILVASCPVTFPVSVAFTVLFGSMNSCGSLMYAGYKPGKYKTALWVPFAASSA